jgi:hypothetical protein
MTCLTPDYLNNRLDELEQRIARLEGHAQLGEIVAKLRAAAPPRNPKLDFSPKPPRANRAAWKDEYRRYTEATGNPAHGNADAVRRWIDNGRPGR